MARVYPVLRERKMRYWLDAVMSSFPGWRMEYGECLWRNWRCERRRNLWLGRRCRSSRLWPSWSLYLIVDKNFIRLPNLIHKVLYSKIITVNITQVTFPSFPILIIAIGRSSFPWNLLFQRGIVRRMKGKGSLLSTPNRWAIFFIKLLRDYSVVIG